MTQKTINITYRYGKCKEIRVYAKTFTQITVHRIIANYTKHTISHAAQIIVGLGIAPKKPALREKPGFVKKYKISTKNRPLARQSMSDRVSLFRCGADGATDVSPLLMLPSREK